MIRNRIARLLLGRISLHDRHFMPAQPVVPRIGQSDYPDIGYEETALSDAQPGSVQKVQLELSIAPDGILDLCRLGWLDPDTAQDPEAVGDAVAELTSAALSLRLRPSM